MAIIIGSEFIQDYYWKYVDVTFKPIPDDFTIEDRIDNTLTIKAVRECKKFGLTAEETSVKLKLDLEDVKKIYKFDDLRLFNWR